MKQGMKCTIHSKHNKEEEKRNVKNGRRQEEQEEEGRDYRLIYFSWFPQCFF